MSDSVPVDETVIASIRRVGGQELLVSLFETFEETAVPQLAAVRASVERGDAAALARGVHRLRSSVGSFGATRAVELADIIEPMAEKHGVVTDEAARRTGEFLTHVEAVRGYLEKICTPAADR